MRQTEYRRRSRALSDQIVEQVQLAAQAELAWLFRQVQLKIRRVNRFRPHTSVRRPKLQKAYTVSGDLWELFRQRMRASVMRALLFGAVSLAQLERAMFPDLQPIEFSSEEFAALIEPELAVNITHVTNNIKRIVGRRVVGWYNSPGSTMQSLVDNLRPEFSLSRAKRIAQTEVTNLNSRVKEETARTIGASEWWWSTRQDELVCRKPLVGPDGKRYNGCRELHGKRFPIGLPMPPKGSHIACRCSPVIVMPRPQTVEQPRQVIEGLLMRKADWQEQKHPRHSDGKFAPKGQGEAGGGKQPAGKKPATPARVKVQPGGTPVFGLPNPDIDNLPEVREFRKKYYEHATGDVLHFAANSGLRPERFNDILNEYTSQVAAGQLPQDAFRDYMRKAKKIMGSDVNEADLIRLEARIRVGDWRFVQGLKGKGGGKPKPQPQKPEPKKPEEKKPEPAAAWKPHGITNDEWEAERDYIFDAEGHKKKSIPMEHYRQHMRRGVARDNAKVNTVPYGTVSIKKYVDDFIDAGYLPTDESRPYTLISPDGKHEHEFPNLGKNKYARNYLDVVMNRGQFARSYDVKVPEIKPQKPAGGLSGKEAAKQIIDLGTFNFNVHASKELRALNDEYAAAEKNVWKLSGKPGEAAARNKYAELHAKFHELLKKENKAHVEKLKKFTQIKEGERIDIKVKDMSNLSREMNNRVGADMDTLQTLISSKVKLKNKVSVIQSRERASFNAMTDTIKMDTGDTRPIVFFHEFGHYIEANNKYAQRACKKFLADRTAGDDVVKINSLRGHKHYDDDEVCKPDNFKEPYCGKIYSDGSTEILSMGLQEYCLRPVEFAQQDPEYFALIYDICHGNFEVER